MKYTFLKVLCVFLFLGLALLADLHIQTTVHGPHAIWMLISVSTLAIAAIIFVIFWKTGDNSGDGGDIYQRRSSSNPIETISTESWKAKHLPVGAITPDKPTDISANTENNLFDRQLSELREGEKQFGVVDESTHRNLHERNEAQSVLDNIAQIEAHPLLATVQLFDGMSDTNNTATPAQNKDVRDQPAPANRPTPGIRPKITPRLTLG